MLNRSLYGLVVLAVVALVQGCGTDSATSQPRLSCENITTANLGLAFVNVSSAKLVTDDASYPAYCKVRGKVNERTGIDGNKYAIRFEMRLPVTWNGRFLSQANGGSEGSISGTTSALGGFTAPGAGTGGVVGLTRGFAVMTTDGGHETSDAPASSGALQGSMFSLDPQARLDYGYNADYTMAPIAKNIIQRYYGSGPKYSYMLGCSNGGRHTMVAASRYPDMYDGYLAGDPGFNLPKSAVQHAWDVQAFSAVTGDMRTAFTAADLNLVTTSMLAKCDALDGVADGMIGDLKGCQAAFKLSDLQCSSDSAYTAGSCLKSSQVTALAKSMAGPTDSNGNQLYTTWSYDAGMSSAGWINWKLFLGSTSNYPIIVSLGSPSLFLTFMTPPKQFTNNTATPTDLLAALQSFSFDTDAPAIYKTNSTFTTSGMDFMTMPDPLLNSAKAKGKKIIVFSGQSDPVFAVDDIISWFENLNAKNNGDATGFARLFTIPGMNHCSGGPALDNFDALSALVNWVENGIAPDSITASMTSTNTVAATAFGTSSRTRPLCVWPKIAKYKGTGDINSAANFTCSLP
ncbi:tannase/feruloyl esterase family alpha/beta hydrolase [Geobacter sp. FeAm09]|uniref:tannase/feruloyl esterase family alpha/beta hydrolase n=1 Tax=Geobacter sp. FeAm09 TaxID=2597769 RepID=UPI00143D702A|nr:tannase/feruloyl esterase family alpha/beta hydrolase [Geobacter sp. FeAm09]